MKQIVYIVLVALFMVSCGGTNAITKTKDFRATAPEAGPAPSIQLQEPTTFTLENGLQVIVVENHKLPTVNMDLYFDYPSLYEGDKAGLTSYFGELIRAGTENYSKEDLDEELDFYGIDLFTGSRSIGFNTLKKHLPTAMNFMTEVLFHPTFENQDVLNKSITQNVTGLNAASKNPDAIMSRVGNALMYGTDHPWGEYATEETYQNVTLADLKNHYNTYFKPNIGYLTIVGDVTPAEARALAEDNFSNWEKGTIPQFDYPEPNNPAQTKIAIVDLPTATQSNIYITNLQTLKKANDDYFASVLGNHMLGGSSFARLFLNLREDKGYTYGAYSSLGNDDKMKSRFNAYAKVRNEVTDSALIAFFDELDAITSEEITEDEIATAKSEQTGRFALGLERPETVARFARTILLEDLDPNFYANYLKNLTAQTPKDVLASMQQYVKPNESLVIIVGKADDIADDVKALGYPVEFYDIWANKVADPTVKQDTGDVTPADVISKYFDAVGGQSEWEKIKTISSTYSVDIAGLPMQATAVTKSMTPNKTSLTITAPGIGELIKQVFDGESGYVMQMGTKIPYEEAQIEASKAKHAIADELKIDFNNATIDNIVDVDGENAYKLVIEKDDNQKTERYYSVNSGLLLKVVEFIEAQGQSIVTETVLSNYETHGSLKLPKKIVVNTQGQEIVMEMESVQFNEGVTESDFQ